MDNLIKHGNKDLIFKGQDNNEIYYCFFRKHWVSIIKNIVYLVILSVISILIILYINEIKTFIYSSRENKIIFFIAYIALTIKFHKVFYKILNFFINTGIITNLRIVENQKTLFIINIDESIRMDVITH